MHMSHDVRVLIVDDNDDVRRDLCARLSLMCSVTVAGEASNGQEAIEIAKTLKPDVVIMDLEMPILGGLDATYLLKSTNLVKRVIILTVHGSDHIQEMAFKAGADAFVEKGSPMEVLETAIFNGYNNDSEKG